MRSFFVYILVAVMVVGDLTPAVGASPRDRSVKTDTTPKKSRKRKDSKLLDWVGLDWVDINFGKNSSGNVEDKNAQDLKDLMAKLANARGKSGAGNGKGAGSKLTFNDNAPKNGSAGNQDKEGVGDRGGQPPGGGGNGGPDESKVFPLYWPVCMFFDPSVDNGTGNAIVKGSVDMAAACGVNLFVVPITVKSNYSDRPDEFNPRQQKSCNMQSIGISTASTLLVNKWPLAAAKMCEDKPERNGNGIPGEDADFDPGIAGCAQVRSGGGMSKKNLAAGSSGGMASGGIIPSTIVPSGWNAGVASHEFLGHSQMGWDNYVNPAKQTDAGLGIGSPERNAYQTRPQSIYEILIEDSRPPSLASEGDTKGGGGWTDAGCAQMRAMALPNDKKFAWNPKQMAYYQRQEDPAAQWNLGDPLWGPTPPSAPPTQPPLIANNRQEPPAEDEKLFFDDSAKKGAAVKEELDGRHKKQKGGDVDDLQKLFTSLRKRGQPGEENAVAGKSPGSALEKSNGASLTFDESAKKADGSTPGSSGSGISGNGGTAGNGDGSSLTFDESAAKNGAGGGDASARDIASLRNGIGSVGKGQAVKAGAGSLDEDFFGPIIKADRRRGRRVKGATLRERIKERAPTATGRPVEGP